MSIFARISREAKILIGLTCLAGASLIWFNFFTQNPNFGSFPLTSSPPLNSSPSLPQGPGAIANESVLPTPPTATTDSPEVVAPDTSVTTEPQLTPLEPNSETPASIAPLNPDIALIPDTVVADPASLNNVVTPSSSATTLTSEAAPPIEAIPTQEVSTEISTQAPVESSESSVSPNLDVVPDIVVVTPSEPLTPNIGVSKDISIAELPFLITSPPSALELDEAANAADILGTAEPEAQRVSVNPFAPLVLAEVVSVDESALVEVPIPEAPQVISNAPDTVVEVAIPTEPATPLIPSPVIRNITVPPGLQSTNLPRALPSGTLPTAPSILRQALSVPIPASEPPANVTVSSNTPEQAPLALSQTPIISTPNLPSTPVTSLATPSLDTATSTEATPPLIVEPLVASVVETQTAAPTPVPDTSTVVGASELSRYLRDNNVRFTGSVLGPVSVGIFRSLSSEQALVVTLGSSFPGTDFVLTSLQGQQAEFTHQQTTQTLPLDLRR